MDYQQIALGVHLIGFALGLGGATISDITFFKALRSKSLTAEQFSFLHTLSKVIWVGLTLLIVSGLIFLVLIYTDRGSLPLLASSRFQTKLTLVMVVLLNGFFFKFSIFPALKKLVGPILGPDNMKSIVKRLAFSGTISILSWYSIFVLSLLPRTFRPPYFYFIAVWLILLVIGFLVSKYTIRKFIHK